MRQPSLEVGPMTSVVLGGPLLTTLPWRRWDRPCTLLERAVQAVEAVGLIFLVLENTVEELETSLEEVETTVEAVEGSVRPPQVLEEI